MASAKEMFQKLGYKVIEEDKYRTYRKKKTTYCYLEVVFGKEEKKYSVNYYELHENIDKNKDLIYGAVVDMDLMKAIIQQCKEFGWYE